MKTTLFFTLSFLLAFFTACHEGKKENAMPSFDGDYVTEAYYERAEGYDWTVVSIRATSDKEFEVSVRSRADLKKPTCTFSGIARLTNSGDSLVAVYDEDEIYFTRSADTLFITGENQQILHYFCSGGASLNDRYIRLREALDETQLKESFDGRIFTYPGSEITYSIAVEDHRLVVSTEGLTAVNDTLAHDITGYTITNIEIGDLNGDTYPELLVYLTSDGSGSYGKLIGYSPNNGKSVSQIYLPEMEKDKDYAQGYMGHDEMAIVETTLCRRFPIYGEKDTNASPSGKMRQIQYKLVDGENGRVFKIDQVLEF